MHVRPHFGNTMLGVVAGDKKSSKNIWLFHIKVINFAKH